jgi:methanogenic corrinoid protein MtbC1
MTMLNTQAQELLQIVLAPSSSRQAATFTLAQLDAGAAPQVLVADVLAPVQVEVGELWQRNVLTTADEHAATAAVDNALAALAVTASVVDAPSQGTMAVVCAEGDWHTLPARMAAEQWRWAGWDVAYLGGSLPADDLTGWLSSAGPDVLAVTCSVSMFIPGALRVAGAAAAAGVSCVVGGRGFGTDDRRAAALGLRWAASPAGLGAALRGSTPTVLTAGLDSRRQEQAQLTADARDIVEAAVLALTEVYPAVRGFSPQQLASTKQDYHYILKFLGAAVLCDDPQVFNEFLDWQQIVLTSRGLPPTMLQTSVAALGDVLPSDLHHVRTRYCGGAHRSAQSTNQQCDCLTN